MPKSSKKVYRIAFYNRGKVYEIYARKVFQGDLYGFVGVEELVFGEQSAVLVNPSEERLQNEFAGVARSYIPLQAVVRIDEVEKEGVPKIHAMDSGTSGNVTPFPHPAGLPGGPNRGGGRGGED